MFSSFVFRITTSCNKKCPTCCCGVSQSYINPDRFREKLAQISRYFDRNPRREFTVFLTGGEPFFYRKKSDAGRLWNITSIVQLTRTLLPKSNIVVKSGGWNKNTVLDRLLSEVEAQKSMGPFEIRFGFNLFQNSGADAEDRLYHMLSLLLKHQDAVIIETIYDKVNKCETFRILGKVFSKFLKNVENFGDEIPTPTAAYIIKFPFFLPSGSFDDDQKMKKIIYLLSMPAHSGLAQTSTNQYFDCENSGLCPNIQYGPNQIMYDTDMSFHHCNDAFLDFSIPPFSPESCNSVEDEFLFLNRKFTKLRKYWNKHPKFKTKNEQCSFCTKFIHDTA